MYNYEQLLVLRGYNRVRASLFTLLHLFLRLENQTSSLVPGNKSVIGISVHLFSCLWVHCDLSDLTKNIELAAPVADFSLAKRMGV